MKISVACVICPVSHFDHFECSECGYNFGFLIPHWDFCPKCGTPLVEKGTPCGHPDRFWKVEVNQDAWCTLCAVDNLAMQLSQTNEKGGT